MKYSKKNFKVSVVFPSYNESENIEEAIKRVSKSLGKQLYEVIVVDDNSPDKTWKIVENMKNPKFKVIRRVNERGLASAIATGVEHANGNVIAWLDCDLGVPPEIIKKLVKKLENYDVAIGSRYVKGGKDLRPRMRAFASLLVGFFANVVLGFQVRDYASGVIAIRRKVTDKIKLSREGFGEYFMEFVYKSIKRGYKVTEVGYVYKIRKGGLSKSDSNLLVLGKYGVQYILKIIKIRLKGLE